MSSSLPATPATSIRKSEQLPLAARLQMLIPGGRFKLLQRHMGGMLEWRTYRQIYRELKKRPDFDAVEIGGARGSGSIAAAWAFRDLNRTGRLIVVEKLERGSRAADGTYEENLEEMLRQFRLFGVENFIRLFPHHLNLKNGPDALALVKTEKLSAIIHDADGRLERDFYLFWPRLVENGFILVDDYEETIEQKTKPDGSLAVYGKKLLTFRLLNLMAEWGLFVFDEVKKGTAFGHKPVGADFARFDMAACKSIVQEIQTLCASGEKRESCGVSD